MLGTATRAGVGTRDSLTPVCSDGNGNVLCSTAYSQSWLYLSVSLINAHLRFFQLGRFLPFLEE